jgi:Ca2+/Na+ antiporter
MSRHIGALGVVLALVSVPLLWPGWSTAAVISILGSAVIAVLVTGVAALVAGFTVANIRDVKLRAGLYLVEVVVLVVASTIPRPPWPQWIIHGLWAGLWASIALTVLLGILLLFVYLVTSVYVRRKNRHHVVAELVQTLLWLLMRIDDADRPEGKRCELSRQFPPPSPTDIAVDLEYLATLIEIFVPRHLESWDRTVNRAIGDRCRGIAETIRGLKLEMLLSQRRPLNHLAAGLANAVVPIALDDWTSLAYTELADRAPSPSLWNRTFKWFGRIAAAVAPLALVFILRSQSQISDKLLDSIVPVAVTWLLVSVVTWIDPGSGDRATRVKDLWSALPGVKST